MPIRLVATTEKVVAEVLPLERARAEITSLPRPVWVDVEAPGVDELEMLQRLFNLHPLAVEDCLQRTMRPKIEDYDEHFFLVLHGVDSGLTHEEMNPVEVHAFLHQDFLVTVHDAPLQSVETLRTRVAAHPELLAHGTDWLLHAVVDAVVDGFFPVLDDLERKVEVVERQVFDPDADPLPLIFRLKKDVLHLRRMVGPQRDLLSILTAWEHPWVSPGIQRYFRDVYDHALRICDALDIFRDLLFGATDSYLSVVNNRMNAQMKVLSIVATIMLPLTLIASIYGMNFAHLPGAGHPHGFYWLLGGMGAILGGMLWVFRRVKWF